MPPKDLTSRYPYYVLGVLFCVNVLNLTDRQVVYILFPLLKADLQFTDTQLGALGALPFAPYLPNPQKSGIDSTCPFTDKSILWTYSKTSGLRSSRTV